MKGFSVSSIGVPITLRSWRDISIAISRKYLRGKEASIRNDEEGEGSNEEPDEVEDLQAAYGTHVAGMVYARGIQEQSGVIETIRAKYRRVSER